MNFGEALEVLKEGGTVARTGWNGKGMFLLLVPGMVARLPLEDAPYADSAAPPSGVVRTNAHIAMKTATGEIQPGWLASQSDMLSDDWCIIK